jgi:DNA-directed RNA polymerase subunit K/omega
VFYSKHIERLLAEIDKRYEQRFVAQERAMELALEARNAQIASLVIAHNNLEKELVSIRAEMRQLGNFHEFLKTNGK